MKYLRVARYALFAAAGGLFAISSQAGWTYTETETVVNGVSKGHITDGVWTFYAERAKGVADELTVDASKGMSIDPAQPAKIDFSEIEGGYKVVKFVGVRNTQSPLVLYTTEFIAPHCTNLSGQEIFYPGNAKNTTLTKIQLREDVAVTLGNDRMFCNCTYLTSFTPKKIAGTSLRTEMFDGCSSLEGEFEFPECTSFAKEVFNGCAKLGGIKAENAISIGQSSFNGCSSLSNIVLSSSVEYIGNYAFKGCSKITAEFVQGILHKGLKRLGNSATDRHGCFLDCTGLTGSLVWNLPNLITNAVPNVCFSGCTSLERVEIKSPVSVIGTSAFFNLKKGAEVYLPNEPISVYESHAVATGDAPFPRVYIGGDINSQLAKMYAFNNNLIKKEEFNDTTWKSVLPNQSSVTRDKIVNDKMLKDETMCSKVDGKVVVKDRNVVAFIMGNTNNGCWILKKPEIGFKVIVR
jgi:hypothetical protein